MLVTVLMAVCLKREVAPIATVSVQERARIMGKFTVSLQCRAFLQHEQIFSELCQGGTGCQRRLQLMSLVHIPEQKLWEDNQEELALIESLVITAAGSNIYIDV